MTIEGKVYLVGAGPGDPGLLTLKGRACLAEADLVLYDGLVNPLLLRHSAAVAERTSRVNGPAGKRLDQAEINRQLVAAAKAGKTVVRLKGGDPFVFGRGTEEAAALREAGIPFEIVPGITAATAAAEYAGISVTHRKLASAVAFVTGHEDPAKPATLDYAALAAFPGTLVFYMGLARLPAIALSLMQHGLAPGTPACVVSRASTTRQQTVSAPLSDIARTVSDAALLAPSLIIVGRCAQQHEALRWFEDMPLFGKRIGITRAEDQAEPVIRDVTRLGGDAVLMPLLTIEPPADDSQIDAAIARLCDPYWIAFTSANGVHAFFQRLAALGLDARALSGAQIGVVGTSTAEALCEYHIKPDLVASQHNAATLAAEMGPVVDGCPVLWPRGDRGRDDLIEALAGYTAAVEPVVVYRSVDLAPSEAVRSQLAAGAVDWIGVSSPSVARGLAAIKSDLAASTRLAAISADTARAAEEVGLAVAAVAQTASWAGIVRAIVDCEADA